MKKYTLRFRAENKDMLDAIEDGVKTVETRAATPKYRAIKEGDWLTFVCGNERIVKQVASVQFFKSVEDLFEKVDLSNVMPNSNSVEDAIETYHSFPDYMEKIKKFGLQAFYLK